ncbi:carbohydrate-binding protein [Kibdelosporangium persicum]|uniref:Carbohydrate binding module (Family 35) n=1 Tax=Kibdelosporangium persicum TaxID=2698649 RepID=A0ABX2F2G4_9PSEU|nr:carbohydrate-binding protein [Kibdelosporangium persicum]NRN65161.1 Carbohydrate binding module (Family 35) [Kibdelosporangium persicum]
MNRRVRWAVVGAGACAVVAVVTTLLMSPVDQPVGARITVPQADATKEATLPPPPSSVSVILPAPPIDTPPSTAHDIPARNTPATVPPEHRRHVPAPPPPEPAPPKFSAAELQAENARVRHGDVESEHAGFTGSGYVNYDNEAGSSVEWTVTASTTTAADVVFRFANGSSERRPMDIRVNGILARTVTFPVTDGWSDWRTVTVPVNLLAGTNTVKATATTSNGGPNVDRITLG